MFGKYILVQISAVREEIFEPFFFTAHPATKGELDL